MTGGRVAPEAWAGLIGPVADRLLADRPCRKTGGEWRFGARGSLVVHAHGARAGTWYDFESGAGGGTLALVEHLRDCDRTEAFRWLDAERLRRTPPEPTVLCRFDSISRTQWLSESACEEAQEAEREEQERMREAGYGPRYTPPDDDPLDLCMNDPLHPSCDEDEDEDDLPDEIWNRPNTPPTGGWCDYSGYPGIPYNAAPCNRP